MIGEDLSDEQLMLMFRYGNRAAFELLFEKYRGPVYNFARRMLGDRQAAEDVCQDVFLRVVTAAKSYEPSARLRTWLFTIARNCCVSAARHKTALVLAVDDPGQAAEAPEDAAALGEACERLEEAIAVLPDAWREAFLLRCRHGLEYQEIAAATGQPVGTVKTHIHRARRQLAEAMQEFLEAE